MPKRTCSEPGCDKAHRARGLCTMHWKREHGTPTRYEVACEWCGAQHMSARKTGYACSQAHRRWVDTYRTGGPSTCGLSTDHPARMLHHALTKETGPTCRVFIRECVVCASWFASPYTVSTCRDTCAEAKRKEDRRAGKDRRRALKREAFVAPVYRRKVYERDGWRCHLCGKAVKRKAVVPDPLAPTIDHVIPLAAGGTHEPANVATAHFLCNARKGDRGGNEQLMLIG